MRLSPALLFSLLLLCAVHSGTGQEPAKDSKNEVDRNENEVEEETETEKEKTDELTEENDVLVLHDKNFARALSEHKYLLVEFYAPWCGHCHALEPIYAKVASLLKNESSPVRLAKIDAIEERELADEFRVSGFPALKFFTQGDRQNFTDFSGKRNVKGIVQWLRRRMEPSATPLNSAEDARELLDAHDVVVVGFFKDLDGEKAKTFHDLALDLVDINFGVTDSAELFTKYDVQKESLVLFKKFDDERADLDLSEKAELDKDELTNFIRDNSLEFVIPFNEENSEKIFTNKVNNHILLFINTTVESQKALLEDFRATAAEFKGEVLFILIDINAEVNHVLSYFTLSSSDVPTIRLINTKTIKKYVLPEPTINKDTLRALCQGVLDGTVKVPEDWDQGPVKVLVGKNFEQVAFDETKNVFVEFYAPWCGHCQELAPEWEKLGEKYKDHENIVIAKMDSTANEVESVTVKGYPSLKYFPAGPDREIVDYMWSRDLETFIKFLDNGGVLPEEAEEEEDEDEEDEEEEEEEEQESNDEVPSEGSEESEQPSDESGNKDEL